MPAAPRREPECGFADVVAPPRRDSAGGGGELAFLRFNGWALGTIGFGRSLMENDIGLAARFSGGGGGARLASGE